MPGPLIGPHGGYRNLRAYQLSEIINDATVVFTGLYVDSRSRTVDQMVQAARSGKQNIAEGTRAAGTSKKTELRLVNVARSSLEELLLDYEDYLRQNGMETWAKDNPKAEFIRKLRHPKPSQTNPTDPSDPTDQTDPTDPSHPTDQPDPQKAATPYSTYKRYIEDLGPSNGANTMICLIHQANYLLDQLLRRLEQDFVQEGGFTEKLYRVRKAAREQEKS